LLALNVRAATVIAAVTADLKRTLALHD